MVDEKVKQEITEEAEETRQKPKKRALLTLLILVGISAGLLGAAAMRFIVAGGPASAAEAASGRARQTLALWQAKHEPWTLLSMGKFEFSLGKNKPQISAQVSLMVRKDFVAAIGEQLVMLRMEVETFFRELVASSQGDLLEGDFNKAWNDLERRLYEGLITGRNPVTDEKIRNESHIFPFNRQNLKAVHIGGLDSSPTY